jgi:hypothetical protein
MTLGIEYSEKLASLLMDRYIYKIDVNNDGEIGLLLIEKSESKIRELLNKGIGNKMHPLTMSDESPADNKGRLFIIVKS